MTISPELVYFENGGVRLVGERWEGEGPGGVVVLLHGGGQTRHSWQRTAARLAREGTTTLALDARGHGDSEWDAGEDYSALASRFPAPPASAGVVFDGDEGRLTEAAFLRDFAGDLPKAKARVLYAAQWPFQKALLTGKTTHAAWRSKPSFYAVSTEDRTINPDLERFMAKRMGATTIEIPSSHLSLISHPQEVTELILQAVHAG